MSKKPHEPGVENRGDVHVPAGSLFGDVHTTGDAGVPYLGGQVMPNDGPHGDAAPGAPVSGNLATSGVDDQMRGDTVTGLGLQDTRSARERD